MPGDQETSRPAPPAVLDPAAGRWVFLGMLLLGLAGFASYKMLRAPAAPPPPEVAADPLLLEGRTVYEARCLTCHGPTGRGDGPIAGNLIGPPVGNLSNGKWKHGDRPEDVLKVIAKGVPGTRMSGWDQVLDPGPLRAVAAYAYYLAGQPVPAQLRDDGPLH
ncbi:Cbb3-type cytochrome c oxidase subunit CcoP2 [Aquisphaera giovannonii]|uniref:Cbb3-type cytochrome c oxidase subunit CcoP2 n=1 Tax=Aquisphaera giovannonii TaxID=406548 RepID=A0A5B9W3E4_9BACT|nr:cytochrome c [Aquisphaera giovannonii]QEH34585.1 Cbb3-type cytochrome c oxidase subunit CcoP2 [Aquisphaera giovannonii]